MMARRSEPRSGGAGRKWRRATESEQRHVGKSAGDQSNSVASTSSMTSATDSNLEASGCWRSRWNGILADSVMEEVAGCYGWEAEIGSEMNDEPAFRATPTHAISSARHKGIIMRSFASARAASISVSIALSIP